MGDRDEASRLQVLIDGTTSSRWTVRARKPVDERVQVAFLLPAPLAIEAKQKLRVRLNHHGLNNRVAFGRFRISITDDEEPSLSAAPLAVTDGVPLDVLQVLAGSSASSAAQALEASVASQRRGYESVARHYRRIAPILSEERATWVSLHERWLEIRLASESTLATRALQKPRETRMLERGNWLTPGEVVTPAVPSFLPPLRARGQRPDRLDLARWLIRRDNPLTARVVVNRFFKLFFGRGLSPALDDLGSQGGAPSHPQLLDALAERYIESGWNTKAILRTLVTSRSYRQSSQPTEQLRSEDPYNTLLARQERMRLEAEFVRDNALAISGLLSEAVGGPSVRPYQPAGYWRNANTFGGSSLNYTPSPGPDQYRRGLYTYWKRSFLHPSLLAFDAPSREECTANREVSNTPLQALALLNDPTYVEAARVLASATIREGGAADSERIDWLLRRALLRSASEQEVAVLSRLLEKHRNEYRADPEAVASLLSIGQAPQSSGHNASDLAAWTSLARVVLNLPEVITRY